MRVPEDLRAAFAEETAQRTVNATQILCALALVLFPLFGILDFILYPHVANDLVFVRVVVTPIFLIGILTMVVLRRRGWSGTYAFVWPNLFLVIPAALAIDALIYISGGGTSPYYCGLSLIIIGVQVSMPWRPLGMGLNTAVIWLQYLIIMMLVDPITYDTTRDGWRIFVSNNYFLSAMVVIGLVWAFISHRLRVNEFVSRHELQREKERSEELLLNILPVEVADELKAHGRVEARNHPHCTIVFTDFVGFTQISNEIPAAELVRALDHLFAGFDQIIARHGLEKLKTIGDSYMFAGGIPVENNTHLVDCVLASLEIIEFLDKYREEGDGKLNWRVRVGVNTGPVTAGVIGRARFAYDVWGDTVNTAARLEASSDAGFINVTTETFRSIGHLFTGKDRGYLPVKGKGLLAMSFVTGLRPEFARDEARRFPNEKFREAVITRQLIQPVKISAVATPVEQSLSEQWFGKETAMGDGFGRFKHLDEQDKIELRLHSEERAFGSHDVLIEQGQHIESLLLLLEGHVRVQVDVSKDDRDARIDVSILGPGDLIGEMSFVTDEATSARVIGIEAGKLLEIPYRALDELMTHDPGFGVRLFRSLAGLMATRLRNTNSKLPPLIVEEVAQVNRFHSTLTGRLPDDSYPEELAEAVEIFKDGMLDVDRTYAREAGRLMRRKLPESELAEFRERAQARVNDLCDYLNQKLTDATQNAIDKGHADGYGAYTLRETFSSFMKSRFCDRSFSKPRGYAGDYATIELIYQNEPKGDGRLGPLIDSWLLNRPSSRAVRDRRKLITDGLLERFAEYGTGRDDMYRVMSLGSGSARELFDMFMRMKDSRAVRATCLDIDMEALAFGSHLAHEYGLTDQFLWTKENVMHLGQPRGMTRPAPQDVVYSSGLFDYLRDDIAIQILNWTRAALEPEGLAIIGNFADTCPDRALMDYILDWQLIYRTPDEMLDLFRRSAFRDDHLELRKEPNDVNLYVFARRKD
ncbi:MAG: cyclic nucleotide-binding domain-containing protein [Myxococcales bacterium]|nr:cyclic nucleotide-binding domain-containing protein [Myxococcales bacterium]